MGYKYSAASLSHLSGVTPKLRKVFETAINIANITILDGIRTKAEQEQNLRTGASQTMNSRHLPQPPDNLSAAVDAVVWPTDWDLLERGFQAVKRADPQLRILEHFWMMGVLKGIAYTQGVDLRQGIDWNGNGEFDDQTFMDMDHSEIRK